MHHGRIRLNYCSLHLSDKANGDVHSNLPEAGGGMTITIYGIKNCDTMKKARTWLEEHKVKHDFHDYKTAA